VTVGFQSPFFWLLCLVFATSKPLGNAASRNATEQRRLQAAQRWRRSGGARGQIDASAGAASEPRGVNSARLALQLGQRKPESDLLGNVVWVNTY
jgi:hypothetical protein